MCESGFFQGNICDDRIFLVAHDFGLIGNDGLVDGLGLLFGCEHFLVLGKPGKGLVECFPGSLPEFCCGVLP